MRVVRGAQRRRRHRRRDGDGMHVVRGAQRRRRRAPRRRNVRDRIILRFGMPTNLGASRLRSAQLRWQTVERHRRRRAPRDGGHRDSAEFLLRRPNAVVIHEARIDAESRTVTVLQQSLQQSWRGEIASSRRTCPWPECRGDFGSVAPCRRTPRRGPSRGHSTGDSIRSSRGPWVIRDEPETRRQKTSAYVGTRARSPGRL